MQDLQGDRPNQGGRLILFAEHSSSDDSTLDADASPSQSVSPIPQQNTHGSQIRLNRRSKALLDGRFSERAREATNKISSSYQDQLVLIAVAKADQDGVEAVDPVHVERAHLAMRSREGNEKKKLVSMMPGILIGIGGSCLFNLLQSQDYSPSYVIAASIATAAGAFAAAWEAKT